MAISKPTDQTQAFNSVYNITMDMSGWDKVSVHVVPPFTGSAIFVYGTNDGGAVQGQTQGNAKLAINFSSIQATNLSTGAAVNSISAAGIYTVPINAQYLRLQGSPAAAGTSIYKLLLLNSKTD